MRNKLNPDGTRIRVLRIERGWTQEQLAEIAGVSSRTVQRAESANCASFDTVRALAGAFEMDFGQLLKQETDSFSNPEPQMIGPADMLGSAPEIETIQVDLPETTGRSRWAVPLLLISTLILGLVAGVAIRSQFEVDERIGSSVHSGAPLLDSRIEASRKPAHPAEIPTRKEEQLRKSPSAFMKTAVPKGKIGAAAAMPDMNPPEQQTEALPPADPSLHCNIQPSHEFGSLELSQKPENPIAELEIPGAPLAGDPLVLPDYSNGRILDKPDPGAVRQAMDVAVKETGAVVSKVGISLKRIF